VHVTCARDLCLRENTDYLTDAELRVEPCAEPPSDKTI